MHRLAIAISVIVLGAASVPASATVFAFAQGYSGQNVNVRTQGTAPRSFIQIWHQPSATWCGYYSTDAGGSFQYNLYCSSGNPTYDRMRSPTDTHGDGTTTI